MARSGHQGMTKAAAAVARVQRATCRQNNGTTPPDSFAARFQSAVARQGGSGPAVISPTPECGPPLNGG